MTSFFHRLSLFPIFLLPLLLGRDSYASRAETDIQIPSPLPRVFQEGEELTYEVRWTMFKIGTICITTFPRFSARARIDSYENLPFVDLHSIYSATMDTALFSRGSRAIDRTEEGWGGTNYMCDSTGFRVFVEDVRYRDPDSAPYQRRMRDTVELSSPRFVDGLSIGYLPRLLVQTRQRADIPTILNGKLGVTTFYFEGEHTEEEIDACDRPVRVVEVHGQTNAVGVFGMTGEFTGWFSDDQAAVPIKGKLNVLLGSVTVELIRWNRRGWSPPLSPE